MGIADKPEAWQALADTLVKTRARFKKNVEAYEDEEEHGDLGSFLMEFGNDFVPLNTGLGGTCYVFTDSAFVQ